MVYVRHTVPLYQSGDLHVYLSCSAGNGIKCRWHVDQSTYSLMEQQVCFVHVGNQLVSAQWRLVAKYLLHGLKQLLYILRLSNWMMLGYVTLWTIELLFAWENVLWFLWCHIWFWACAIKIDCEKYLEKVNRYLQCRLKLSPGWGAVSRQLSCWCYYSWRLQATRFVARCLCHSCGNSSPVPSGHALFEYSLKVINPINEWFQNFQYLWSATV